MYVCLNIRGARLCGEINKTAVCTNKGRWEPSADNICAQRGGTIAIVNYSMSNSMAICDPKHHYHIQFAYYITFLGTALSQDGIIAVAHQYLYSQLVQLHSPYLDTFVAVVVKHKNRVFLLH